MGTKKVGRVPTGKMSAAMYWNDRLGYPPASDLYNLPQAIREVLTDKHGDIAMFNYAWEILTDAKKRGVRILDQRKYYEGILRKLLDDRRNVTKKAAAPPSWEGWKARRLARTRREDEFVGDGEAESEAG